MAGKTASKFVKLKKKAGKPAGISEKSTRPREISTDLPGTNSLPLPEIALYSMDERRGRLCPRFPGRCERRLSVKAAVPRALRAGNVRVP